MRTWDREAKGRLGSYTPNAFRGFLSKSLVSDDGRAITNIYILAHEYWHYLHNISTLVGFNLFRYDQGLVFLFSQTAESGIFVGASRQTSEQRQQTTDVATRYASIEGDRAPTGREQREVSARIVRLQGDRVDLQIEKHGHLLGIETMTLGSVAIEESIAFLVESMVATALHGTYPPAFVLPYHMLWLLSDFIIGSRPSDEILAGLGTLALLDEVPSSAIAELMGRFKSMRGSGVSEGRALEWLADETRSRLRADDRRIAGILDEIVGMHHKRGTSEKAAQIIVRRFRQGIAARQSDPLFDIRLFLGTRPLSGDGVIAGLDRLFEEFPPCDFTIGPGTGAEIASFVPPVKDDKGIDASHYVMAFEAQRHLARAHLKKGSFVASSSASPKACPFLDVCILDIKCANCASDPWVLASRPGPHCSYSNGVIATVSNADIVGEINP